TNRGGVHVVGRRGRQGPEAGDQSVVRRRQSGRRGHFEHDFGQGGGAGEAADVGGQLASQRSDLERREGLQLAAVTVVQLGDALAQQLQPRSERTPGSQRAFGDRALDSELPRGEAHDFGGLAVAIAPQNDGGRGQKRHRQASSYPTI